MTVGVLFWIIFVFVFIFGGIGFYRSNNPAPNAPGYWLGGFWLAVWIELGLLGWKAFGPLLQ